MFKSMHRCWLLCLLLAFGLQSVVAPAKGFAMAWQQHGVANGISTAQAHESLSAQLPPQLPPCHAALSTPSKHDSKSEALFFGAKCSYCAACIMAAALPSHDIGLSMQVYGSDALIVFIPQYFVSYIAEVLDPPPRQLI